MLQIWIALINFEKSIENSRISENDIGRFITPAGFTLEKQEFHQAFRQESFIELFKLTHPTLKDHPITTNYRFNLKSIIETAIEIKTRNTPCLFTELYRVWLLKEGDTPLMSSDKSFVFGPLKTPATIEQLLYLQMCFC